MRQKEEVGTMVIWKDLKTNSRPPKQSMSGSHIQRKQPLVEGVSLNDRQVSVCLHSMHGLQRNQCNLEAISSFQGTVHSFKKKKEGKPRGLDVFYMLSTLILKTCKSRGAPVTADVSWISPQYIRA